MTIINANRKPIRLTEIDLLRALAAIAVVALHALGYSLSRDSAGSLGHQIDQILIASLRFARQAFLFASGFALAYAYRNRMPGFWSFISGRSIRILLPYLVWTWIYLKYSLPEGQQLAAFPEAILLGNAFYHLYFIIVSLQWYLLFPFVLGLFRRIRPDRLLPVSGLVAVGQLAVAAWLAAGGQLPAWAGSLRWLSTHREQLLLSYLGFYLLGTLAGLHGAQVIQLAKEYLRPISLTMVGILAYVLFDLVRPDGRPYAQVIDIFQPLMTVYGAAGAAVLLGLSARIKEAGGWLYRSLLAIGRDSYAIYLAHPLVLFLTQSRLLSQLEWHPLYSLPLTAAGVLIPFAMARFIHITPLAPILFGRGQFWPRHIPAQTGQRPVHS